VVVIAPARIIDLLNLKPLSPEGGYYIETYRSEDILAPGVLPGHPVENRVLATAIYFLLTPDTFSAMHRLPMDEIYHFYLGDPVELLQLLPDGSIKVVTLGHDILRYMVLQEVVRRGAWQGSRLVRGGSFALLGTTTAPGFETADFEPGDRQDLIASYPAARHLIAALTP
jgi:predicted cupin superfamily sugar epimerase